MSQIKIFSTDVDVLVNHLNYANHLGHDALLSILQEARLRWLKSIDPDISEISIASNVGFLVRKLNVVYHHEAHHGDQLNISLYTDNIKKTCFDVHYVVTHKSSNKKISEAMTTLTCFDFSLSKVVRIPSILKLFPG